MAGWTVGWADGYIPTVNTTGAARVRTYSAGQKNTDPATLAPQPFDVTLDASRVWGDAHTGAAFAPEHVRIPLLSYLGIPA